jgi:hypothetical protein
MIAALIAYGRMSVTVRGPIAHLVRSHPRFGSFATVAESVAWRRPAEQDRWYFAFASTWPDAARRFDNVRAASARDSLIARYNHGSWHYINLPTYLQPADRRRIGAPVPSMAVPNEPDDAHMNVVQALETLTQNWCGATDAQRALSLAWITHLTADVHQPLSPRCSVSGVHSRRRGGRGERHSGNRTTPLHADNLRCGTALATGGNIGNWAPRAVAGRHRRRRTTTMATFRAPIVGETEPCVAAGAPPELRAAIAAAGDRQPACRSACVPLGNARHGGSSIRLADVAPRRCASARRRHCRRQAVPNRLTRRANGDSIRSVGQRRVLVDRRRLLPRNQACACRDRHRAGTQLYHRLPRKA